MATTRGYADQLASQGSYHRAVLYYLACHDTYKAIEVFKSQAMYRYDCFKEVFDTGFSRMRKLHVEKAQHRKHSGTCLCFQRHFFSHSCEGCDVVKEAYGTRYSTDCSIRR